MLRFHASYGKPIINSLLDHILTHRAMYHITKFNMDIIIKAIVKSFLVDKLNSVKSLYHKSVSDLSVHNDESCF